MEVEGSSTPYWPSSRRRCASPYDVVGDSVGDPYEPGAGVDEGGPGVAGVAELPEDPWSSWPSDASSYDPYELPLVTSGGYPHWTITSLNLWTAPWHVVIAGGNEEIPQSVPSGPNTLIRRYVYVYTTHDAVCPLQVAKAAAICTMTSSVMLAA